MALINKQDLTVSIHLNLDIPEETLHLACNVLALYLSQNEDKTLKIDKDINNEIKVYIDTIQNKQTQQALKENIFRPNKETLEAIDEARRISNQDGTGYKSFEEMTKDVLG